MKALYKIEMLNKETQERKIIHVLELSFDGAIARAVAGKGLIGDWVALSVVIVDMEPVI